MRHYTDVKAADAEVVTKFYELLNQKAVCEYFGYKSNSQVQTVLKRNGVDVKKVREEARFKRYKEYRDQDMTYDQIARLEGLSKDTVENYCRKNGLGYSEEEWLKTKRENKGCFKPSVDWSERIKEKFNGLVELVGSSRAKDGEFNLNIKCNDCGVVFVFSSITLRRDRRFNCQNCKRLEQEKRNRLKKLDQEERKRQEWINRPRVQLSFRFCECGMLLTDPKRKTCDECLTLHTKEAWRREEIRRRARERKVETDSSISLERLYERDNGICYLCGRVCDWNDGEWRDGVFRVGKNYPSIEHVKPISKGGSHTWNNIRLACVSCNSKKGNRELSTYPRIYFFLNKCRG